MSFESYFEKISEESKEAIANYKAKYPEATNNVYPRELMMVIQKYVKVHGHSYCMDVVGERRKISKLLYRLLTDLNG